MTGNNPFSLEGRTILVTGASSGIGRRTAIDCSRMGARVIITGRNKERLDEVMGQMEGTGNLAVIADLTQQDQLEHLLEQLPLVDGVVLCAGQGTVVPFKMADRKKNNISINVLKLHNRYSFVYFILKPLNFHKM